MKLKEFKFRVVFADGRKETISIISTNLHDAVHSIVDNQKVKTIKPICEVKI